MKSGNGFVKEYDFYGDLSFEGQYLNGEKNGFFKEYDYSGVLIFEGEYINGQRNGKGKEYSHHESLYFTSNIEDFTDFYIDEENEKDKENKKDKEEKKEKNNFVNLLFDGEYLNGRRYKGREYDYDGKLIYEGKYLNGKRI